MVTQWGADKRSKVDVVGLKNNVPAVLIEIELKKDNPVENVVKIWHWRTKKRNEGSILFVQAFSAHYLNPSDKNSTPSKAKQYGRAVFIGRQMAKDRLLRIRYKDLARYTAPLATANGSSSSLACVANQSRRGWWGHAESCGRTRKGY